MTKKALVIGGTGPTGPGVVTGLLERGYEVKVLHTGKHENPGLPDVPHIHVDPNFHESLSGGLKNETFDLVMAQYGRLEVICDVFPGMAETIVAIGSATGRAADSSDPRWGPMGRPQVLNESNIIDASGVERAQDRKQRFIQKIGQARAKFMDCHERGLFKAVYLGYPAVYGPYQPAQLDWAIIRRILDGRKRIVVADGGRKIDSRLYTGNAVAAVLCAVDNLIVASGKTYMVSDANAYTCLQRISLIAKMMGHEFEFVDLPYEFAIPAHPYWRFTPAHGLVSSERIRSELGFQDAVPSEEAIERTVEWILNNKPEPGGEAERAICDPFDYEKEDAYMDVAESAFGALRAFPNWLPEWRHPYDHPKGPSQPAQQARG